eukprot:6723243-Karenia_brevis.AAC.1
MHLDGRGLRLKSAAAQVVGKTKESLSGFEFNESHDGVFATGAAATDFAKRCVEKGRLLAATHGEVKSMLKRVEHSTNAEALREEVKQLDDLSTQ